MVLNSITSTHNQRRYADALELGRGFCSKGFFGPVLARSHKIGVVANWLVGW